jgi:hypothetical protein
VGIVTTAAGALDPVELLRDVVEHTQVSRTAAGAHPLWSRVFAALDRGSGDDVDALVEKLDARCAETGERWDVYRLHPDVGGWRAHAHAEHETQRSDPAAVDARGATIREALARLLATPRLPVVPRRPAPAVAYTVVKVNGWFEVQERGLFAGYRSRLKREAVAVAERGEKRALAAYEEWVVTWGPVVEAGVEGVDFYWKP